MTFRWIRAAGVAAGLVAIVAVAAGCGDDDKGGSTGTTVAVDSGQATKVDSVPASAPVIDQNDLAFKPDKLTVPVGQAVFFKDSESAIHTVTINGKNVSGTMKKGDIVSWTPPAAGTYRITCDYHPQMHATITAGESLAPAASATPK